MPVIAVLTTPRGARELARRFAGDGRCVDLGGGELEIRPAPPLALPAADADPAFRVVLHTAVPALVSALNQHRADLVVLDNRPDPGRAYRTFAASPAGKFLPLVSGARRDVRPVARRQIVLLVGPGEHLGRDLYVAGAVKLGGYLIDDPAAPRPLLPSLAPLLGAVRPGKLALCLAGGGIEGLIYELGVLRALDEFLVGRRITDFDIFCGISAGAVIAAFLANGVAPAELTTGMKDGTETIDPIHRGVLFRPNLGEVGERLGGLVRRLLRRGAAEPADPRLKADPLEPFLRLVPGGFLSGEPIKWWLEEQLTRPGRTNCFTQLKRELYIGATDQDTNRHIVFGEPGRWDVPISHAVRASTALVPYYPPEPIGGRYLVDGAFTRTTNFSVAIRHGARLAVIVNPFIPVTGSRPGSVDRQGGVFAALQGVKALVHSRFEQTYSHLDEVYPDVDFQTFLPEGEELEQLTGTLMKFFYRTEIADLAYEHTVAKIRRRMPGVAEMLARHGLLLRDPADDAPVSLAPAPEGRVAPAAPAAVVS